MKILINKVDKTKAILLAFGEDDIKTLHVLHTNHIVFGMYAVWFKTKDTSITLSKQIQPIVTRYPSVEGIAFLNIVEGFIQYTPKEIK